MKLSICISFKSDWVEIDSTIMNLLTSCDVNDTEIIVCNDGSTQHSGRFRPLELSYPNTTVINNSQTHGVGYSFDRCVEQAKGEIIVLMGCDVLPHAGWYEKVIAAVESNTESIGCAVCVSNNDPNKKYYGADMLFTYGTDDLPLKSKLRDRRGGFTDLFRGRWASKKSDEPYEISCLMGAFYFTTKAWYQKIRGFDTVVGNRWRGHRAWGHLESYLSLKSYLYGGNCVLHPDIEATHLFDRITREQKWSKGSRSADAMWWNALFMLETMVLNDFTRNRLYDFIKPELNYNMAKKAIKDHYSEVEAVRGRNRIEFKRDLSIFTEKFGINPY